MNKNPRRPFCPPAAGVHQQCYYEQASASHNLIMTRLRSSYQILLKDSVRKAVALPASLASQFSKLHCIYAFSSHNACLRHCAECSYTILMKQLYRMTAFMVHCVVSVPWFVDLSISYGKPLMDSSSVHAVLFCEQCITSIYPYSLSTFCLM